ncbi:MAG: hypothetical protein QM726_18400 [Chitinophagaceae bacterium]
MYKVKLFKAGTQSMLEDAINEWLRENKDILIHQSNMAGCNGEDLGSNEYTFFMLYSGPDAKAEELKEIAAAVSPEQSIEVKEINPEILKPSS